MNDINKTFSLLNKLEELDKSKFNSSEFAALNADLQDSINNFTKNSEEKYIKNLSIEDKKNVIDLISKIEFLEAQILPKADLINSFSNSLK